MSELSCLLPSFISNPWEGRIAVLLSSLPVETGQGVGMDPGWQPGAATQCMDLSINWTPFPLALQMVIVLGLSSEGCCEVKETSLSQTLRMKPCVQ